MRRRSAPAQPRAWRQRAILGNAKDAMDTRRAPWVWSASRPLRSHSVLYVKWFVLDVDAFHAAFGIAGAGGGADRDHVRDRFGLLGSQPHLQCAEIFLKPLDPLGARDRDHVGALRQEPGKAELRDGAALVGGDRLDAFDERAVLLKIVAGEARVTGAGVALGEVGEIRHDAGEQAAPQGRVGDKGHAEIARRLARFLRLLTIEQRIFALYRSDRMHRMGTADALGVRLAEAEMAHLALLDEAAHRTDRVLDRHARIDAVLVVEVDRVDPEPLQAGLAGLLHVFGAAVDAVGAAGLAGLAEFGGDDDLVRPALQRAAEQFLVVAPAIHVRAVEMIDAELDRAPEQGLGCLVVARSVGAGQGHAAEPDRQYLRPVLAQPPPLRRSLIAHDPLRQISPHHSDGRRFVTTPKRGV